MSEYLIPYVILGKKYYFNRDGRWYEIIDPKRRPTRGRWANDPNVIELGDVEPPKNYRPAPKAVAERLNRDFFPTGWQKFWKEFSEASARQLQVLAGLALKMQGVDSRDIEIIRRIMRERQKDPPTPWSKIFDKYGWEIFLLGAGAIAVAAGVKIFGAFFRLIVKRFPQLVHRLLVVVKKGDSITVKLMEKAAKETKIQLGISGQIVRSGRHRLEQELEVGGLEIGPAVFIPEPLRRKGLAFKLMRAAEQRFVKEARKLGIRRVHFRFSPTSESAVGLLKKLGYQKVPNSLAPFFEWQKVVILPGR